MKIIVANNNIAAMLSAAEAVLKKFGKHEVPEHIKGQATLSALKHMFERDSFSICTVNELARQNDIVISQEHKNLFNSLHCVSWSEMHEQTREYLFAILVDYFRSNIVMANSYGDTSNNY